MIPNENDRTHCSTSEEEYELAYQVTVAFLRRTLNEGWCCDTDGGVEENGDYIICEEGIPAPLTPSVCSTSARFLRRPESAAAATTTSTTTTTTTTTTSGAAHPLPTKRNSKTPLRVPAFGPLQSHSHSNSSPERGRRRSSLSSQARRWIPMVREGSSLAAVTITSPQTQAANLNLNAEPLPAAWQKEVYSSWNHGMAQVIRANHQTLQYRFNNHNPKLLLLQPPIAGLPGGWSATNVVHATHMAMEHYVQQATDLFQSYTAATKPTASKDKDALTLEEQSQDTIVDSLIHYILHKSFSYTKKPDTTDTTNHTCTQSALLSLSHFAASMPRKVCQHAFKKNELVWVCRTCQSDETCVLCHSCYQHSCHEGHDVSFYHAQAGGCCDCGDPEAWDPKGFCPYHGGGGGSDDISAQAHSIKDIYLEARCGGVVRACAEWLMTHITTEVEQAHLRANPPIISTTTNPTTTNTNTMRSDSLPLDSGDKRPLSMTDTTGTSIGEQSNIKQSFIRKLHSVDGSTNHIHVPIENNIPSSRLEQQTQLDTSHWSWSLHDYDDYDDDHYDDNNHASFNPEAASTSKSKKTFISADDDIKATMEEDYDLTAQQFLSHVAGSSKVRSSDVSHVSTYNFESHSTMTPAQYLGWIGSQQYGLYLILHADDIHTMADTTTALRALYSSSMTPGSLGSRYQSPHYYLFDTILTKIARLLKLAGDIIVYGTHELMAELGPVLSQCWKDGDISTCARFGALMLEKAKILTRAGFVVSIKTRLELYYEVRAKTIVKLLTLLSESCDPLCLQVSLGLGGANSFSGSGSIIQGTNCLTQMLLVDLKLPMMINTPWHSLLLLLLSNPVFKRELADSYCEVYSSVSHQYANGIGLQDRSCFILSVQFLNRASFVQNLVHNRDLITLICRCLLDMFSLAQNKTGSKSINSDDSSYLEYSIDPLGDNSFTPWTSPPDVAAMDRAMGRRSVHADNHVVLQRTNRLDTMHPVLLHKRYIPLISDFKYVLNVKGMARLFSSIPLSRPTSLRQRRKLLPSLDAFLETLTLAQSMDEHVWRKIEDGHIENESKSWIVAFNTSISLGSLTERLLHWEDDDPIPDIGATKSMAFLGTVDLAYYVLSKFVLDWIRMETIKIVASSQKFGPNQHDRSLPNITLSSYAHMTVSECKVLPLYQSSPWSFHLPLFRFVSFCLLELSHRPYEHGYETLLKKLLDVEDDNKAHELFRSLMEFVILLFSRVSQIKAGLWRRNGTSMLDQVLNYSEIPFCRLFRDADIILLQFSILGLIYGRNHMLDKSPFPFSLFIHLMINRFGLYTFVGLDQSLPVKVDNYSSASFASNPSKDRSLCLAMLDDFLHTLIIMVTELPLPSMRKSDEVKNTTKRLRRELIHRLASGPKTHSELGEVIHILSYRDNEIMVHEGKKINPDDAVGSLIQSVLKDIATCVLSKGALNPDEYQLDKNSWAEYDPAFFHMSSINHQIAAENRPCPEIFDASFQPYSPSPPPAHIFFSRLRQDLTSDATVIAIIYRILHAHLSPRGDEHIINCDKKLVYNNENMSETVLSRALHILTLGAHAWMSLPDDSSSSSVFTDKFLSTGSGSIFSQFKNQPSFEDWINCVLLGEPEEVMQNEFFRGDFKMIILLKRLGEGISLPGKSTIRDKSLRCGALWLCKVASAHSATAALVLGQSGNPATREKAEDSNKQSVEYRMNEAKQRILLRMRVDVEKFAREIHDKEQAGNDGRTFMTQISADEPGTRTHERTLFSSPRGHLISVKDIPRCVICVEEDDTKVDTPGDESAKVLTYCAFIQSSTVLLGAATIPSNERSYLDRFVGSHISLCGHAVHSSCCDSYLKALTAREDRLSTDIVKRSEFKCPLCQRVSNCLVPYIDSDPVTFEVSETAITSEKNVEYQHRTLDHFLRYSKWWSIRNDKSVLWDGRCLFFPNADSPSSSPKRNTGKGELYRAWDVFLSPYRLLTNKRLSPRTESSIDIDRFEDSADYSIAKDISSSSTDVWRRLIDVVSDISYRADLKRLGETELADNFGEYRHYLVEKHALNNALIGKSPLESPQSLSFINTLSEQQQRCNSREKPIARLLASIQTFAYTCCAESMEFRRLIETGSSNRVNEIRKQFGISDVTKYSRVLVLATPLKEGRFGRLRHFILALMRASSALHREIVQLSVGFPAITLKAAQFNDKSRAPMTYPIICSHVLTHITAAICSVAGVSRLPANHDSHSIPWIQAKDTACHFVALGLVARVLQTLLYHVNAVWDDDDVSNNQIRKREEEIISILCRSKDQINDIWSSSCRRLLLVALDRSNDGHFRIDAKVSTPSGETDILNAFNRACEKARLNAEQYLRESLLILQLAMPWWSYHIKQMDENLSLEQKPLDTLEELQRLIGIAPLNELLQSSLVEDVVQSWYLSSKESPTLSVGLKSDVRYSFRDFDWPLNNYPVIDHRHLPSKLIQSENTLPTFPNTVPLIGLAIPSLLRINTGRPRLDAIPQSYTDLYAQVSELLPYCEQCAFCFICGEVLNANGSGECTRHCYTCGGGAGIFFLLQECVSLLVFKDKAAYFHSPYVDSHGETLMSRGRPLNMDMERYETLCGLYCGHVLRQQVISERSKSSRHTVIANFY